MSSSTFAVRYPGGESIRFAYWVPNVSGGLVISNIEYFGKRVLPIVRELEQHRSLLAA